MNEFFKIDKRILGASDKALKLCKEQFENIEKITEYNQQKVQKAFIDNRISETHFGTSTGYGYGDIGRETLDKVWAQVLGAESALVRHNFTCGTHTLATALFGVLRPGDNMLCVSGTPYDTIHNVIGISGEGMGSLKEFGINYDEVALKNERLDFESIENAVNSATTMVYIQRSRGYELRPSLSVDEIGKVCEIVKKKNPNVIVMVDNCYGEFVEMQEPTQVGADLIAGSMIKNAGGLAILAHPVYITEDYDKLYSLLKQLKEYGLDGTECLYNCYSEEFSKMCFDICDKLGLVKSGGSDFHGGNKPDVELGKVAGGYVPYEFLLNMKEQRGLM